jgi:hypothetical protein
MRGLTGSWEKAGSCQNKMLALYIYVAELLVMHFASDLG